MTVADDGKLIALVYQPPPGRLVTQEDGRMVARNEQAEAQWSLNALAQAAKEAGIAVKRSHSSARGSPLGSSPAFLPVALARGEQVSETLASLEQASTWDSRRHLEGDTLMAAEREHPGEEETSDRRPC
ncbi:MAG TPA: hypothetical protein VFV38_01585 [Ktedonobacteraceae bacterium]|nr:hypothetical protein [Ktedonobacteraceae bacterium]